MLAEMYCFECNRVSYVLFEGNVVLKCPKCGSEKTVWKIYRKGEYKLVE